MLFAHTSARGFENYSSVFKSVAFMMVEFNIVLAINLYNDQQLK